MPIKTEKTSPFDEEVRETQAWFESPRFAGSTRLYSARQVVAPRGTIPQDYTVARQAAEQFYTRLRGLFEQRRSITTFGPYSPGQAVAMKRLGIEGIYLGGWATSAKGSETEDPGPDLASYPLSQVPAEANGRTRNQCATAVEVDGAVGHRVRSTLTAANLAAGMAAGFLT